MINVSFLNAFEAAIRRGTADDYTAIELRSCGNLIVKSFDANVSDCTCSIVYIQLGDDSVYAVVSYKASDLNLTRIHQKLKGLVDRFAEYSRDQVTTGKVIDDAFIPTIVELEALIDGTFIDKFPFPFGS